MHLRTSARDFPTRTNVLILQVSAKADGTKGLAEGFRLAGGRRVQQITHQEAQGMHIFRAQRAMKTGYQGGWMQ